MLPLQFKMWQSCGFLATKRIFSQSIWQCVTVRHSKFRTSSSVWNKIKKKKRMAVTWTGSNLRGTRHVGSMTALYFIRSSVTLQDHHHLCIITVPSCSCNLRKTMGRYLKEIDMHILNEIFLRLTQLQRQMVRSKNTKRKGFRRHVS